jgi:hypothetical protein
VSNGLSFSYRPGLDVVYRTLRFQGFPGYRVGTDGSVWSRRGSRFVPSRGAVAFLSPGWRRLRPSLVTGGYQGVCLCRRPFKVHRLVLAAFVGPCPPGKQACHFPDPDRQNNRLENLRWDTPRGNMRDRAAHGNHPAGAKNGHAKLSESQVRQMRRLYDTGGWTQKQLARHFGTCRANVSFVVTRKHWRQVI